MFGLLAAKHCESHINSRYSIIYNKIFLLLLFFPGKADKLKTSQCELLPYSLAHSPTKGKKPQRLSGLTTLLQQGHREQVAHTWFLCARVQSLGLIEVPVSFPKGAVISEGSPNAWWTHGPSLQHMDSLPHSTACLGLLPLFASSPALGRCSTAINKRSE